MTTTNTQMQPPVPDTQLWQSAVAHVQQQGYSTELIERTLGPAGWAAATSQNPQGAVWSLEQTWGPVAELDDFAPLAVAGFILHEPLSSSQWEILVGPRLEDLQKTGFLATEGEKFQCMVDLRPVSAPSHGSTEQLILSDPDASVRVHQPHAHHVPGVGNAPLSLLNVIPPVPDSARVLDLGCGSGVIGSIISANYPEAEVVGTDISARALDYAHSTSPSVDWREGSWFEPVSGEEFDMIVSNPPFVIGPGAGLVYRQTELHLDEVSRLVVEQSAHHLAVQGTAHILIAWAVAEVNDGASAVSQWVPDSGFRAWVVQRDVVDVVTYVRTWLLDESIDPRSAEGRTRTQQWLDYFAEHNVRYIGMGYIHLQKLAETDHPTEVTFEPLDHALQPGTYLGDDVREWFLRAQWLDQQDAESILDSHLALRPSLAVEDVSVPNVEEHMGLDGLEIRITRTDGPAWTHVIDEHVLAVLKGLNPDGLTVRDVAGLYSAVHGIDDEEFASAVVPVMVDLIRHGLVLPVSVLEQI